MSRYIAAYDVADDGRRASVAHVLLRYGDRLQRSVFEVWLDCDDLAEIRREIGPLLDEEDQFELIPIDLAPARSRWRWGGAVQEYAPVVTLGR